MRVEVRLYATLAPLAPKEKSGEPFDAEVDSGASLAHLIRSLGIPAKDVHLSIVNGRLLHDRSQSLHPGDRVGLFPPVGGG